MHNLIIVLAAAATLSLPLLAVTAAQADSVVVIKRHHDRDAGFRRHHDHDRYMIHRNRY